MKKIEQHANKLIIILFLLLMIYTAYQTFLTSDDLIYSFVRLKYIRITNINQIIRENIYGYCTWTGRFIIHCIIQSLLIFGKNIWSILNPAIISIYIVILSSIEKKLSKQKEYTILLLINITLFLSITEIKYSIYWLAGSINYIWPLTLIIYYTYKNIENEQYENKILLFIIATLQELSLIYIFIFTLIKIYRKYKKTKKIDLTPLIPIILGGTILLAAPGNFRRLGTQEDYNRIIQYFVSLKTSLKLVFNIKEPIILLYLIICMLNQTSVKTKLSYILLILLAQFNSLFYIPIIYLSVIEATNKEIALSFYATMIFMTLIPSYKAVHPYIYVFTYMIIEISIYLINFKNKKMLLLFFIILATIYGTKEFLIYKDIGQIKKERMNSIQKAKINNEKIIKLKKIKDQKYLIDGNATDTALDTKKYLKEYYRINENVKIEFID